MGMAGILNQGSPTPEQFEGRSFAQRKSQFSSMTNKIMIKAELDIDDSSSSRKSAQRNMMMASNEGLLENKSSNNLNNPNKIELKINDQPVNKLNIGV